MKNCMLVADFSPTEQKQAPYTLLKDFTMVAQLEIEPGWKFRFNFSSSR